MVRSPFFFFFSRSAPPLGLRPLTRGAATLESALHFRGLLVLVNPLKPTSAPTLAALRTAGIRCNMVRTGCPAPPPRGAIHR